MQIFALHETPSLAARYHFDCHVGKGLLEAAQILCTAAHLSGADPDEISYKPTHKDHPCVRWVRAQQGHADYLIELASCLQEEHMHRWGTHHRGWDVAHRAYEYLTPLSDDSEVSLEWLAQRNLPYQYVNDGVEAYRDYYITEKAHLKQYTNRDEPVWWEDV